MTKKDDQFNFKEAFETLEEINEWFQSEDMDLDEGLKKYREGAELIKQAKSRLTEVENEFKDIREELSDDNSS